MERPEEGFSAGAICGEATFGDPGDRLFHGGEGRGARGDGITDLAARVMGATLSVSNGIGQGFC